MNRATVKRLLDTLRIRSHVAAASEAPTPWSADDIKGLGALLRYEGAELWFYRQVQRRNIVIPDSLRAELRAAAQQLSVTNMRIDAQTLAVTSRLTAASIPWSLLKGQARRAGVRLYPFADARRVSDVDLLVPEEHARRGWDLLIENGFRQYIDEPVDWSSDHHLPTLIDASNVAVELHTTTAMSVPPAEAWRRATEDSQRVVWSEIEATIPSPTELVWQALAHGASDGPEGYLLKAFLSVAAVIAERPPVDWSVIERRVLSGEALDNLTGQPLEPERLRRFLAIAADLAGCDVPRALVPVSTADLVPLLTWRASVLDSARGRATKGRLLEESARVETMSPLTPTVASAGLLPGLRRRAGSLTARAWYLGWRGLR